MYRARKGRKRLAVDIPIKIHQKLSAIRNNRRCTITKYVIRAIIAQMKHEGIWQN